MDTINYFTELIVVCDLANFVTDVLLSCSFVCLFCKETDVESGNDLGEKNRTAKVCAFIGGEKHFRVRDC